MAGASKPLTVDTKRQRIAELARQSPEMGFTSLAHLIDIDWLEQAYHKTRKDDAPGVDGQTGEDYAANRKDNLQSLLDRAKSGTYQAPPVRRVHIPKAGSATETRPLGIPICRSYCTSLQRGWGLSRESPALPWACLNQEAERRVQERHRDHALFIAYAPADAPTIALSVLVENGGHGASAAAPIARAVMDFYLLGKEPPAKPGAREEDEND